MISVTALYNTLASVEFLGSSLGLLTYINTVRLKEVTTESVLGGLNG